MSYIIGIDRHRFLTDGKGVTTLVAFHSCPLECAYCINPQSKTNIEKCEFITPQQLYEKVKIDDLYFLVTGGGITFGGGEPLLQSNFIESFKKICSNKWRICVETSLNVEQIHVDRLIPIIDEWIIDIKDWSSEIYKRYTNSNNDLVKANLNRLLSKIEVDKIKIRVPSISNYNKNDDVECTVTKLKRLGINNIEQFTYEKDIKLVHKRIFDKYNPKKISDDGVSMGKFICEVLKEIRIHVAECNNIPFTPRKCPNKICSTGFCPICDQELKELTNKYYQKINNYV